jgi:hypothetical protein
MGSGRVHLIHLVEKWFAEDGVVFFFLNPTMYFQVPKETGYIDGGRIAFFLDFFLLIVHLKVCIL